MGVRFISQIKSVLCYFFFIIVLQVALKNYLQVKNPYCLKFSLKNKLCFAFNITMDSYKLYLLHKSSFFGLISTNGLL